MKSMNIQEYIQKRKAEREWLQINGYENADSSTNGEFRTLEFLKSHFSLFVDIGANKGDFLKHLQSVSGGTRMMAFEPNPLLCDELKKMKFKDTSFSVHPTALSNKKGKFKFFIYKDDTASSLNPRTEMNPSFHRESKRISVSVNRLDDYEKSIFQNVSEDQGVFIKIDTEGVEFPVIKGAKKILKRPNPLFMMFEYSYAWNESGNLFKDAFYFLDSEDVEVFRVGPLGLEKVKFYRRDMDSTLFCNYLAVKNFKLQEKFPALNVETKYTKTILIPFEG